MAHWYDREDKMQSNGIQLNHDSWILFISDRFIQCIIHCTDRTHSIHRISSIGSDFNYLKSDTISKILININHITRKARISFSIQGFFLFSFWIFLIFGFEKLWKRNGGRKPFISGDDHQLAIESNHTTQPNPTPTFFNPSNTK